MTRFDLISPRPRKDGKTFWVKIGAAFPRDKGGYSLILDALPLPDADGKVSLLMVEPTPRDERPAAGGYNPSEPGHGSTAPMPDDEIPF